MSLVGKGWFIWQVGRCEGGSPQAVAEKAVAAGLTHVLLKVAERTFAYGFDRNGRDLVAPVVDALRQKGLQVWGWHYVYGEKPVDEARIAVQRSTQLGLDGYVVDAEVEYKQPGRSAAARTFMSALRSGLPGSTLVALSSFRYPSLHRQLPWRAFLEHCDLVMPQVYWEQAHNPAQQLARSVSELSNPELVGFVRPVVPTGAAYGSGNWRATPDDVAKFLTQAQTLGLAAANLYSWDYATSKGNTDLWDAAAQFDWATGTIEQPRPENDPVRTLVEALNSGDANRVLGLYHPDAGHVTAARTLIGREALALWYTELLGQKLQSAVFTVTDTAGQGNSRHFRWKAAGPAGEILDGDDTLGLAEGRILYHYTSFTFQQARAHTLPRRPGQPPKAIPTAPAVPSTPKRSRLWWWPAK